MRDESGASGGHLTNLVFSGGTSVQEYTGAVSAGNLAVEYVRGSDYGGGVGGVLYSIHGATQYYDHANRRGDIVNQRPSDGSTPYQAQYAAFGNQVSTSGTAVDRQKSNSKDTDPTNLVDEGFRYRDLETGMFINRDPAGFVDGPNLYTYVVQNPWTKFDPEGLTAAEYYEGTLQGYAETALPWTPSRPANQSADYKSGLMTGHAVGAVVAVGEMHTGGTAAAAGATGLAGGTTLIAAGASTGPGEAVAAPAGAAVDVGSGALLGAGTAMAAHGAYAGSKSAKLLAEDLNDASKSSEAPGAKSASETKGGTDKEVGSYTNTHESGKTYDGKGTRDRMNQSAKEKAEEHNDPVVKQEFTSAKNDREAFKDEDTRIQSHGGPGAKNPNTYNKINSPGKKYKEQDQQKDENKS